MNESEALAILTGIPHLGAVKIRGLIRHFGSALEAVRTPSTTIAKLPEIGEKVAEHWDSWRRDSACQKNLDLVQKLGITLLSYQDPGYPKRLLEISDHPVLLYVQGEIKPCDQRSIAVVGTRQPTLYGKEMAEKISAQLAAAGFTVVSGFARGIDVAAHDAAFKRGRTLAVIGSGLANIYPREFSILANEIIQNGALISEFPMMTPPDRQNFPQRNRIVSGMTMATLLIEAPLKSGAMITVEKALTQKRQVFALPGRADCENFKGNHQLIKSGQAQLIENATDLLAHFGDLLSMAGLSKPTSPQTGRFGKEEQEFLAKLPLQEISIEEIVQITQLSITKVNILLMGLVLKKGIKEFPGRIYKKYEETHG